jgi:26S proteasome regulatory subunit N7
MYKKTYEKTVALGQKLDIVFALIRIGFFYSDNALVSQNIDKAKTYVQQAVT